MNSTSLKEHLEQLFAECDVDKSGCLGRDEFIELCAKIGLSREAAIKTFDRLDADKNNRITFDEFTAGFNQYKQLLDPTSSLPQPATGALAERPKTKPRTLVESAPTDSALTVACTNELSTANVSPESQLPTPKTQSPVVQTRLNKPQQTLNPNSVSSTRGRKSASPIGVMSLGSTTSSSGTSSGARMRRCTSGSAGYSTDSTDLMRLSGNSHEILHSPSEDSNNYFTGCNQNGPLLHRHSPAKSPTSDQGVVVYSSEAIAYSGDQANGSGQFGSTISSSGSLNQSCNMQELLDCVQKLQNENQILTQIFFKDKREREEYISQLGEEFDQQLREVEERANKRAREELENEKKRLRDMMKTERETLEHHYQTIEKMSRMLKSPNGRADADGETIEKVRSKLEDTFVENRQLKRSLLDTKTDVAMIWKEMEKLKRQYENKLSSAYEKHNETKSECDHIKQQLNLMKDSNRKLQDASDVITSYITDKVEPVIKVASGADDTLHGSGHASLDSSNKLGISSQSNSRRGSILSDYLNNLSNDGSGDLESMASSKACFRRTASTSNLKKLDENAPTNVGPIFLSSVEQKPLESALTRLNPLRDGKKDVGNSISEKCTTEVASTLSRGNDIDAKAGAGPHQNDNVEVKDPILKPILTHKSIHTSTSSVKSPSGLKKIGKHFFIGSRTQSDVKPDVRPNNVDCTSSTKSKSFDQANELSVEPADGPSHATFNIILVGDSFVGKSSFATRFVEGNFVQGLISNCSIDFKTKAFKVDNINYTVNLWDTAGQERFRSITASYFRKADGIILMYDVTDRRTYLNVRNWMATISDTATENVAVLLVGNKVDLRNQENIASCVPTEEGFRLAREYDIVFLETSVKTGTNLLPSLGRLIRLIARNSEPIEEDKDKIRLNDKSKTFNCMPKSC